MSYPPATWTAVASLLFAASLAAGLSRGADGPAPRRRSVEPKVEVLRAEGIAYYKAHKYYQAARAFETALPLAAPTEAAELKELLARTRSALGVELFNAGEIRQAVAMFRQALAEAEDSYAHFGLGFAHFVKLEDDAALSELEQALRLEPTYGKTHKLLALIDYRHGRLESAMNRIEKAMALDTTDKEARALHTRWKTESAATRGFREERRGRFVLRVDPDLPPERVRDTARRLDAALSRVLEAFQLTALPPVVVVLFSPQRFYRATGSLHWVGGLYDGQIKLPVAGGASPGKADLQALDEALRHELTHAVVRHLCPECPNWLNEGLAQHFERPGRRGEVDARLRRLGASKRIRFEDVPVRLWEVTDEGLARQTYLQGLSLVEYLVEHHFEFRLRLLLETLHRDGSLSRAVEVTYGASLQEAESAWWREVERRR